MYKESGVGGVSRTARATSRARGGRSEGTRTPRHTAPVAHASRDLHPSPRWQRRDPPGPLGGRVLFCQARRLGNDAPQRRQA